MSEEGGVLLVSTGLRFEPKHVDLINGFTDK